MKQFPAAAAALLLGFVCSGRAAEIPVGGINAPNEKSGLAVSSADLINGLAPSSTNYSPTFEGGPIANLTDGKTSTDGSLDQDSGSGNAVFDCPGCGAPTDNPPFAIYTLPTAGAPNGYDLTSLVVTAGHQDDRTNQHYDLLTSTDGSHFTSLSAGNGFVYAPGINNGATQSTVTANDVAIGSPFTHIKAVEFLFTNGGTTVFRELDVNGVPSAPEPATFTLASATLALLLTRRRR